MTQPWPLGNSTTSASNKHPFIFAISPDEGSAAFARLSDNTVTVINLRSGATKLVINTGMKVYGLKVSGNKVMVEGDGKLVVCGLPETGASDGITTTERFVQTKAFRAPINCEPGSTSISPNLDMIAKTWLGCGIGTVGSLVIYDTDTGAEIGGVEVDCEVLWFSSDGSQIWCGGDEGKEQGWRIVKTSGSSKIELVPLAGSPPEGWPWRSSRGYTIANDGWVLSREGKRLICLPPNWRSEEKKTRVWSGRFLALLHSTLSEPVILEMSE